jgi:hypothetical protein
MRIIRFMKYLGITVLCTTVSLSAQTISPQRTHGTINVLLANKNGAVLLTDSRLSSNGIPVGEGQKLFLLDDHTVCAIADFYSDIGPSIKRNQTDIAGYHPLAISVPKLIDKYIHASEVNQKTDLSISEKLDRLSGIYTYALELLGNTKSMASDSGAPTGATLTIAGYENGKLRFAGLSLTPQREGLKWIYVKSGSISEAVNSSLVTRVEGITKIADKILANLTIKPETNSSILADFAKEVAKNEGEDLSTEDLEQIATQLELRTYAKYPNLVGGNRQVAVLKDGRVDKFTPPPPDSISLPDAGPRIFLLTEATFIGNVSSFKRPHAVGAVLIVASQFKDSIQDLDGFIFVSTEFVNSTLIYRGTEAPLLDKSNSITGSSLLLGPAVKENDPFLNRLKSDFPHLKVFRPN